MASPHPPPRPRPKYPNPNPNSISGSMQNMQIGNRPQLPFAGAPPPSTNPFGPRPAIGPSPMPRPGQPPASARPVGPPPPLASARPSSGLIAGNRPLVTPPMSGTRPFGGNPPAVAQLANQVTLSGARVASQMPFSGASVASQTPFSGVPVNQSETSGAPVSQQTFLGALVSKNMTPPKYDKEKNTTTSDLQQESSDDVKTEQVTSDDNVEVDEFSDYNSAFGSFTSTISSMSAYSHSPSHEIEEFNDGGITFSRSSSSQTCISLLSPTEQQMRRRNWQNWLFGKPTSISGTTKVAEVGSVLGRARTISLVKAVKVLDTLGSSLSSLNVSPGFVSGVTTKRNKENVKRLKEVLLPSEGVQLLVSKNMDVLLRIFVADKREELKFFSGEVVCFGNRCKDPQYHNLDRYFEKLGSRLAPQKHHLKEVDVVKQRLMTLVRYTTELYHELHALDTFEQNYQRKHWEEENSDAGQKGDDLLQIRNQIKMSRKRAKSLKNRSLWSKHFEEIMKDLVDIVCFLHIEIYETFGAADVNGDQAVKGLGNFQRLGSAGLALHYANIIIQIDTIVSRSSSVPPKTMDALYQGLPPSIKSALRAKLQSYDVSEKLTVPQIKTEMEKTLSWLVPIANNTTKVHHYFGWFSEWANRGSKINQKLTGNDDLLRIETLYHASKEKTDSYILDLVVWLHHLGSLSGVFYGEINTPINSPIRSLTRGKTQELYKARTRVPSKSSSHSPNSGHEKELFPPTRRTFTVPIVDFEIDRLKALDVIDGIDALRSL